MAAALEETKTRDARKGIPSNVQGATVGLLPVFYTSSSGMYSIRSPGWHFNAAHILSSTSTGICLAAPVHIADTVVGRMPVNSANCFWFISFKASSTFVRNFIIIAPPISLFILSRISSQGNHNRYLTTKIYNKITKCNLQITKIVV